VRSDSSATCEREWWTEPDEHQLPAHRSILHYLIVVTALAERTWVAVGATAAIGLSIGAMAGVQPRLAMGLVAGSMLAMVVVRTPTASLVCLIFLTAIVPYGLQNQFGIGGSGVDSPGILLSDVFLLLGLGVAALALQQERLTRRELVAAALITLFIVVTALQFLQALRLGRSVGEAGAELRTLLGFGTYLIALPILHHPLARKRLFVCLLVLAVAVGGWGLVQWFGQFSFGGDVGVREGVRHTTAGTGQLQGSLFAFPVALVGCYAVLLGGAVRSTIGRLTLAVAVALNAISLLLTYERTFWIATLLGLLIVTLRARGPQRLKGLVILPLFLVAFYFTMALAAPAEMQAARERLLSLKYETVDRYRVEESEHVTEEIRHHPIVGSGLAATIFWGRPWAQVPPSAYTYSHNGYLWLAWKVGIPGAAILVLLLIAAILARGPPGEGALDQSIRGAAQLSLLTLLFINLNFPSFSALSITPVMGLLVALSIAAPTADRRD
jgi:O-Antigen ligase